LASGMKFKLFNRSFQKLSLYAKCWHLWLEKIFKISDSELLSVQM
jgi:hypothetical protein